MESSSLPTISPSNRFKAIQELNNGHILINKLHEMRGRPESIDSDLKIVNGVVVEIMGMFDSTLSIMRSSNLNGIPHNHMISSSSYQNSNDFDKNIKTMAPMKTKGEYYKRRKKISTSVELTSTLIDDGYPWRKYGQKVIINSKHQRNYYRCSHKLEEGCQATKQVQKTEDEPSKYKITYNGTHTCNNFQRSKILMEAQRPTDYSTLISFETNKSKDNNKVGTCFSSINHIPKDSFLNLGHTKHEQFSSPGHHTTWDPISGLS